MWQGLICISKDKARGRCAIGVDVKYKRVKLKQRCFYNESMMSFPVYRFFD